MITFTEYVRRHYKPTQKVEFDIQDKQTLTEGVDVKGNYEDYIGPEETHPLTQGYKREYGPIYSHPDKPGKFFHFGGGSTPHEFNTYESALEDNMEIKHRRETNVADRSAELEQHYAPQKYSEAHKNSIWGYTAFDSKINNRLMQQSNGDELSENEQKLVSNLDATLNVEKTPREMALYSGTSKRHAELLRSHDVVEHPSYISTSIHPKKAMNFAKGKMGDVIKIHLPAGHPGAYVAPMSSISSEREFIIPRGLKLRIDHSKREVISDDLHDHMPNSPMYLHHAYPVED